MFVINGFKLPENTRAVKLEPSPSLDKAVIEYDKENDVLVYDDIECKVEKWVENVPLEEQEGMLPLSETEKDSIEAYIDNAEPPMGVSLNTQYIGRVGNVVRSNEETQCIKYGFDNMVEVLIAAREGSAHPHRSNARRVLEYVDALASVAEGVYKEIAITREDTLKSLEDYLLQLPPPNDTIRD